MDVPTAKWFSEMGMEDPSLLYQCQMDFILDPIPQFTPNFSPEPNFSSLYSNKPNNFQPMIEKPAKQQKTNHWNLNTISFLAPKSSSPSLSSVNSFRNNSKAEQVGPKMIIGNIINSSVKSTEEPISPKFDYGSVEFVEDCKRINMSRSPLQAKDHVIAERKRRERLNQSFISLSALLPGLKKLDKATILEVATQHIKKLQEKAKALKEDTISQNPVKPIDVRVTKSCAAGDNDTSSVYNFNDNTFPKQNLEVEVRVWDNNVLIRVNCEKENGIMGKIFREIEKFDLIVVNSNAMPFGNTSIAVSIIAQVDGQFTTSAKDLENNLRSALRN